MRNNQITFRFHWKVFLGACKIYENVEMREHNAKQVLEHEHENVACYVVLSNLYVVGNQDLNKNVEWQKMERGVKKQSSCTCIEMNNEVHAFVLNDGITEDY